MLDALSVDEYVGWIAFFSEEGFPQDKQDVQFSNLLALIANSSGRYKKFFNASDFMPNKWETAPEKRGIDEQARADKEFGEKLLEMQRIAKTG